MRNFRHEIFLILITLLTWKLSRGSTPFDPYSVLGVPNSATSEEIKRQYRKLCLKYHPDKNIQKPPKERKKSEDKFKLVQKANTLIGDDESRRKYDDDQRFGFHPGYNSAAFQTRRSSQDFQSPDYYNEILRRFYSQQQQHPFSPRTTFRFGGVDVSNMFSSGPSRWVPSHGSLKSKYLQKIKIPLQDLYNGKYGMNLPLNDAIWNRYAAAIRGGFASMLLYESLLLSLSAIRLVRFPWSFVIGAIFFHLGIPRPTKLDYTANIQAGWKSGTKLTFTEGERGIDVIFIIEEARHKIYKRIGKNLVTTVTISEMQRKTGCTVVLQPLGESDAPIKIKLKPNQVTQSGDTITVSGLGWPDRRGENPGDLIITVKIKKRKPSR
jgi:DnaJ-class molecular chaperone